MKRGCIIANFERIYQKVTREQLEHCIKWCQNKLNLRDWQIGLTIGTLDKVERAAGWTLPLGEKEQFLEQAEMWIDLDYCKEKDDNPYVVVCHEMLHILIGGKCRIDSDNDEHITYTLDDMLYEKYCIENNLKIRPKKEE